MSEPRIVSLLETTEFSEKKMLSVPSVTMNGGSLIRVTRKPLTAPIAVPQAKPSSSASEPGHAERRWRSLAIRIDENTAIAPTDRSMPAVRMIRVWPSASTAMTVTCASTRDRLAAERNRGVERARRR